MNTKPFEIQISKRSLFKCFWYSNGRYSDPHCTMFCIENITVQYTAANGIGEGADINWTITEKQFNWNDMHPNDHQFEEKN